jgi:DNA-binding response OmpR family regulator
MSFEKARILCIDDDLEACDLVKTYLGLEGFEVVLAYTLAEGLSKAKAESFDLYLINERLPDGSGVDLAHQIRDVDLETPIVFLSASAYAGDIQRGLDAGAQAYITKPAAPETVIETLRNLIAEKREESKGEITE